MFWSWPYSLIRTLILHPIPYLSRSVCVVAFWLRCKITVYLHRLRHYMEYVTSCEPVSASTALGAISITHIANICQRFVLTNTEPDHQGLQSSTQLEPAEFRSGSLSDYGDSSRFPLYTYASSKERRGRRHRKATARDSICCHRTISWGTGSTSGRSRLVEGTSSRLSEAGPPASKRATCPLR